MTSPISAFPSYYNATRLDIKLQAPAMPMQKCDVAIIGGGIAGLTAAHELAKAGYHVALLESHHIGWGASGRNGGFVSAGFAQGLGNIEKRIGLKATKAIYGLSCEGRDYIRNFLEQNPHAKQKPIYGRLRVNRTADISSFQRNIEKSTQLYGSDWQFWDTAQTRDILKTSRYFSAAFSPSSFHIHPLNYCLALAKSAQDHGALIYEQCPVQALEQEGGFYQLHSNIKSKEP